MCVCLAPARLSNTILYVGEAVHDDKCVHVLGYQNTAQNLALKDRILSGGLSSYSKPAGNAMILPFPAASPMGPENVLDASGCANALRDIARAIPPAGPVAFSMGAGDAVSKSRAIVFDTGIYTVVLARDARDIPAALDRVPEDKRPALNAEVFSAYAKWYPGCQVALCCFSNRQAVEADPLLWWYEPAFPDRYFYPTLDSHTGGVPDLEANVVPDHVIAAGTASPKGYPVRYSDDLAAWMRGYLPERVVGRDLTEDDELPNGDFLVDVQEVREGRFDPKRVTPGTHAAISL